MEEGRRRRRRRRRGPRDAPRRRSSGSGFDARPPRGRTTPRPTRALRHVCRGRLQTGPRGRPAEGRPTRDAPADAGESPREERVAAERRDAERGRGRLRMRRTLRRRARGGKPPARRGSARAEEEEREMARTFLSRRGSGRAGGQARKRGTVRRGRRTRPTAPPPVRRARSRVVRVGRRRRGSPGDAFVDERGSADEGADGSVADPSGARQGGPARASQGGDRGRERSVGAAVLGHRAASLPQTGGGGGRPRAGGAAARAKGVLRRRPRRPTRARRPPTIARPTWATSRPRRRKRPWFVPTTPSRRISGFPAAGSRGSRAAGPPRDPARSGTRPRRCCLMRGYRARGRARVARRRRIVRAWFGARWRGGGSSTNTRRGGCARCRPRPQAPSCTRHARPRRGRPVSHRGHGDARRGRAPRRRARPLQPVRRPDGAVFARFSRASGDARVELGAWATFADADADVLFGSSTRTSSIRRTRPPRRRASRQAAAALQRRATT